VNKLIEIQKNLKAPKNQYNSFGKYNYRSAEDILEAVKPLLIKHELLMTISDEIELIGNRVYVKAIVTIVDNEKIITTTAYAREPESRKGMDDSQITGASSSYARKYALNGMFCIDDTKDSDSPQKKDGKVKPKPSLTNNDVDKWAKAVKYLKSNIDKLDSIKENYQLTKEDEQKLKNEAGIS
jgi:hypothetical protein